MPVLGLGWHVGTGTPQSCCVGSARGEGLLGGINRGWAFRLRGEFPLCSVIYQALCANSQAPSQELLPKP